MEGSTSSFSIIVVNLARAASRALQLMSPRKFTWTWPQLLRRVPPNLRRRFFFSGVLSAGGSQRVPEFFRLCRLCRYPGAAGQL